MLLLLWLSFSYILKLPGSNLNVKSLFVMSCQRNVFNFEYMWEQKKAPTTHDRNFPGQTFHMNKNTKKVTGSDHGVKTAQAVHWFCTIGLFSIASRRVL